MANRIEHLVVLMMENRSFDHMFGFLRAPDWPIDGLTGTETNPDITGAPVRVTPDARYMSDLTPDPGHDFISVNEQIFGNSTATGTPNMQGFVKAYQGKTQNVAKSHNVMKCFGPGKLPALSTLAREYAVCDRWFASVPGPTLPNRAFAWAGTSLGRVDMNPDYHALKTVFELLDGHGVSSKIYYTDVTIGLVVLFLEQRANRFFASFDSFRDDCRNNRLPAFSFIEPRFNDFNSSGQFFPAADQHPDHHVFEGEKVIKAVYDAVTANRAVWEKTLLVITYDEHGGLYDHVTPPATVAPGDGHTGSPPFSFERLGVRVPAVLVSPFIPRGLIIHDKVFDHTSIIATASKLFVTSSPTFLTQRDRNANTFEDCLTLAAPRQGKVNIPQPTNAPPAAMPMAMAAPRGAIKAGARSKKSSKPHAPKKVSAEELAVAPNPSGGRITELTAAMIQHAFAFERQLPHEEQTGILVSSIATEQDASEYFEAIRAKLAERHNDAGTAGAKSEKGGKNSAKKSSKKGGKGSKKVGSKKR